MLPCMAGDAPNARGTTALENKNKRSSFHLSSPPLLNRQQEFLQFWMCCILALYRSTPSSEVNEDVEMAFLQAMASPIVARPQFSNGSSRLVVEAWHRPSSNDKQFWVISPTSVAGPAPHCGFFSTLTPSTCQTCRWNSKPRFDDHEVN